MTSSLIQPPVPSDKRGEVRLSCQFAVVPHLGTWSPAGDHWSRRMHDLAPSGVGLLLPERVPVGTRLVIELPLRNGSRPWEVRVVRTEAQPDGLWLHGCESAHGLPPNELLDTLLADEAPSEPNDPGTQPLEDAKEDCFVVFVRPPAAGDGPPVAERPVASCATQAEARAVQQQLRLTGAECVVRFTGPAGGGD